MDHIDTEGRVVPVARGAGLAKRRRHGERVGGDVLLVVAGETGRRIVLLRRVPVPLCDRRKKAWRIFVLHVLRSRDVASLAIPKIAGEADVVEGVLARRVAEAEDRE